MSLQSFNDEWNISFSYTNPCDPQLRIDLEKSISALKEATVLLKNEDFLLALEKSKNAVIFSQNVHTHAYCMQAKDVSDHLWSEIKQQARTLLYSALETESLILEKLSECYAMNEIPSHLAHLILPKISKKQLGYSNASSVLISELEEYGPRPWEDTYHQTINLIKIPIENNLINLSEVKIILKNGNELERRQVWTLRQNELIKFSDTLARSLDSIAGWKVTCHQNAFKENETASLLDVSLINEKISRDLFEAALAAIESETPRLHIEMVKYASIFGKAKLELHDLQLLKTDKTPSPKITFKKAIEIIKESLAPISDAQSFIDYMSDASLIEAKFSPNKKSGAFCTALFKHELPLIFLNYSEDTSSLLTLAHELGHAYHYYKLQRLSYYERDFSNTLAETMSTLFEKLATSELVKNGYMDEETYSWQNLKEKISYFIEIPAAFNLEKRIYESKRMKTKLTTHILNMLTESIYHEAYKDSVQGIDSSLWMMRGHLFQANTSFYNYPYALGHLVSQKLFNQLSQPNSKFTDKLEFFVLNSGRMALRELLENTFEEDPTQISFWNHL